MTFTNPPNAREGVKLAELLGPAPMLPMAPTSRVHAAAAGPPQGRATRSTVGTGCARSTAMLCSPDGVIASVRGAQTRSEVAVACTDSHWLEVQTVSGAQTRSLVAVGAVVSYSVLKHARSAVHARSLVAV